MVPRKQGLLCVRGAAGVAAQPAATTAPGTAPHPASYRVKLLMPPTPRSCAPVVRRNAVGSSLCCVTARPRPAHPCRRRRRHAHGPGLLLPGDVLQLHPAGRHHLLRRCRGHGSAGVSLTPAVCGCASPFTCLDADYARCIVDGPQWRASGAANGSANGLCRCIAPREQAVTKSCRAAGRLGVRRSASQRSWAPLPRLRCVGAAPAARPSRSTTHKGSRGCRRTAISQRVLGHSATATSAQHTAACSL